MRYLMIPSLIALCTVTTIAAAQTDSRPSSADPPPIAADDLRPRKLDANGIPIGWTLIDDMVFPPSPDGQYAGGFWSNFWTGGNIYYFFDSNVDPSDAALMETAMAQWEDAVETLDFKLWAGEPNRIRIRDSNSDPDPGNNSSVGMIGGEQIINIKNWGNNRTLRHELGHALGYQHEQSRPDRDAYVQIEWDNIEAPQWGNFAIPPGTMAYGPYDFESIMHYGQCAWSVCESCGSDPENCRTITVLPPWDDEYQDAIGTFSEFSIMDVLTMSFMYPRSDWAFVDASYVGFSNGSFLLPWPTLAQGYNNEPAGTVLQIQPGIYVSPGVYASPVTFRAPLGQVEIRGP